MPQLYAAFFFIIISNRFENINHNEADDFYSGVEYGCVLKKG
jgi:hypothetical protein